MADVCLLALVFLLSLAAIVAAKSLVPMFDPKKKSGLLDVLQFLPQLPRLLARFSAWLPYIAAILAFIGKIDEIIEFIIEQWEEAQNESGRRKQRVHNWPALDGQKPTGDSIGEGIGAP